MQRREMFSVVIPVYNEEAVISTTYLRLRSVMDTLGGDYELLFVNDGSSDKSQSILQELCMADQRVKLIHLSRNFGHQIAITAGIDQALGNAVIIIDADLQDPPELIPEMVAKWRTGYEVVYAKRQGRLGETRFKRWTATLFYRILSQLTDVDIPLDAGDFRLIDRRVCNVLTALPEQHRFIRGLVSWSGFRQTAVTYERAPRFAGNSKYPFKRMLRLATDAITGFSDIPLKLSLYAGSLLLLICLGLILYGAITSITVQTGYSGADWLGVMSLTTSAFVLMVLGLLGQYLGRMYDEVRRRPLYVVANRQGFGPNKSAPVSRYPVQGQETKEKLYELP